MKRLRLIDRLSRFFGSGSFPAFALCVLFFYQAFIALMVFSPTVAGNTGLWAEFVQEFRIRCFQFDPGSSSMEWGAAWMMLLEPLPMYLVFAFVWHTPLRDLWRGQRRKLIPLAGSAFLLVAGVAAGLLGVGEAQAREAQREFPAQQLRSALPMPSFTLTNQDGASVSPADFRGKVVLMTAVYSTCTTTCPMLLTKIRAVLADLSAAEREQLVVLAFSLNPEQDTRELRSLTGKMYGMEAPAFHFVSGVPSEMESLLDRLGVTRTRDPESGAILHSNLFMLLDRQGSIAYRLSLSEQESSWLTAAVRALLADPKG